MDSRRSSDLHAARLEALLDRAQGQGLDAVVTFSAASAYYLTGAPMTAQRLLPERLSIVVATPTTGAVLIVCDIEEAVARDAATVTDVVTYGELSGSPMAAVARALGDRCEAGARVGCEMDHLASTFYRELVRCTEEGRYELVDCTDVLMDIRTVKDAHEIALMEAAFRATDDALRMAVEESRVTDSEEDVAARVAVKLVEAGADEIGWVLVGFAERSGFVHGKAAKHAMQPGDLVRIGCGACFEGYYTDLGRTCFAGHVTAGHERIYQELITAHRATLGLIQPGARVSSVVEETMSLFEEAGMRVNEGSKIGHGIGLGIHEPLLLHRNEARRLEPGMTLCVEVPYFTETGELFLMEDFVVLTDEGSEIVTEPEWWTNPQVIGRG